MHSEVLARFNGVYLQDGTVISLSANLAQQYSGDGQEAVLRVQGRLELGAGSLSGLWRHSASWLALQWGYGIFHARRDAPPGPAGAVLSDPSQGHADPDRSGGHCWDLLSFLRAQTSEVVDVDLFVGWREHLPVLLLAVRVSSKQAQRRRERANERVTHLPKGCQTPLPDKRRPKEQRQGKKVSAARLRLADWTILLTNMPQAQFSMQKALVLLRLWKLWKQHGKLDT